MLSITRTILLSESGVMALKKLIAMKKAEKSYFSKNYIAKKVGLKSRGYLSDVLSGRKKISARYVDPIVATLDLDPPEATYLRKKLLLDTEFAKTPAVKSELEQELSTLSKNLQYETIGMDDVADIYSLCLVYLSFFLRSDRTLSKKELMTMLPMVTAKKLEQAIAKLLQKELINRTGHQFQVNSNRTFSFANSDVQIEQELQYLEQSIEESRLNLPQLKYSREQVIFHSSLLTTDKVTFGQKIADFKNQLRTLQSDLETDKADSLIRFNLQVYPVISQSTRDS